MMEWSNIIVPQRRASMIPIGSMCMKRKYRKKVRNSGEVDLSRQQSHQSPNSESKVDIDDSNDLRYNSVDIDFNTLIVPARRASVSARTKFSKRKAISNELRMSSCSVNTPLFKLNLSHSLDVSEILDFETNLDPRIYSSRRVNHVQSTNSIETRPTIKYPSVDQETDRVSSKPVLPENLKILPQNNESEAIRNLHQRPTKEDLLFAESSQCADDCKLGLAVAAKYAHGCGSQFDIEVSSPSVSTNCACPEEDNAKIAKRKTGRPAVRRGPSMECSFDSVAQTVSMDVSGRPRKNRPIFKQETISTTEHQTTPAQSSEKQVSVKTLHSQTWPDSISSKDHEAPMIPKLKGIAISSAETAVKRRKSIARQHEKGCSDRFFNNSAPNWQEYTTKLRAKTSVNAERHEGQCDNPIDKDGKPRALDASASRKIDWIEHIVPQRRAGQRASAILSKTATGCDLGPGSTSSFERSSNFNTKQEYDNRGEGDTVQVSERDELFLEPGLEDGAVEKTVFSLFDFALYARLKNRRL